MDESIRLATRAFCARSDPPRLNSLSPEKTKNAEQKPERQLAIDTMASWALEGMEHDRDTVKDINAFIDGRMTGEEFVAKAKEL